MIRRGPRKRTLPETGHLGRVGTCPSTKVVEVFPPPESEKAKKEQSEKEQPVKENVVVCKAE